MDTPKCQISHRTTVVAVAKLHLVLIDLAKMYQRLRTCPCHRFDMRVFAILGSAGEPGGNYVGYELPNGNQSPLDVIDLKTNIVAWIDEYYWKIVKASHVQWRRRIIQTQEIDLMFKIQDAAEDKM